MNAPARPGHRNPGDTHTLAAPTLAYTVGEGLYLNLTNRCSARCPFCARQDGYAYRDLDLRLLAEPSVADVLAAVGERTHVPEIVFCGYGEPTIRLATLCGVADELRARGARRLRLNTNGHGNVIHRRDIVPDLIGRIDAISISLNTADPEQYGAIMGLGGQGPRYFEAMVAFARAARGRIPEVTLTAVELPDVDLDAARRFAEETVGLPFRCRPWF